MFGFRSISSKIFVPFIVAIFIGWLAAMIAGWFNIRAMEEQAYSKRVENFQIAFNEQVEAKANVWLTNSMQLAKNEDIIAKFATNQRDELVKILANIGDLYRQNTAFRVVNVHLLTPELKSYLKSWDSKSFGESYANSPAYQEVLKSKKPLVTFEQSDRGVRFKSIFPVMDGNRLIGLLDFDGGINNFASPLKKSGVDFLYFLDSSYAKLFQKAKNPKMATYFQAHLALMQHLKSMSFQMNLA